MQYAYDLDGVLAEAPPHAEKTFFKMNGEERRARKKMLGEHYLNAPRLFIPDQDEFVVITARKNDLATMALTEDWLAKNFPNKKWSLYMLDRARTYKNVIAFKGEVLEKLGIKCFVEDNLTVLQGIKKMKLDCTLLLYKDKQFTKI